MRFVSASRTPELSSTIHTKSAYLNRRQACELRTAVAPHPSLLTRRDKASKSSPERCMRDEARRRNHHGRWVRHAFRHWWCEDIPTKSRTAYMANGLSNIWLPNDHAHRRNTMHEVLPNHLKHDIAVKNIVTHRQR